MKKVLFSIIAASMLFLPSCAATYNASTRTPVDNGVEIPDENEGIDEIEDTEETDNTTVDNAEVAYTKDEIERLLALGMSRKQIKLLMENGFTYRDVEMALITSMLEESQGTANPFSTEAKSNKSSLKLVG